MKVKSSQVLEHLCFVGNTKFLFYNIYLNVDMQTRHEIYDASKMYVYVCRYGKCMHNQSSIRKRHLKLSPHKLSLPCRRKSVRTSYQMLAMKLEVTSFQTPENTQPWLSRLKSINFDFSCCVGVWRIRKHGLGIPVLSMIFVCMKLFSSQNLS